MELTHLDRKFIALIVRSPEHLTVIVKRLEHKSPILVDQRQMHSRYFVFAKNVAQYLALLIELVVTILKIKRLPQCDRVIFYDSDLQTSAGRIAYLKYHLSGKEFTGVSYRSRIAAMPNLSEIVLLATRLGVVLLQSLLKPSELGVNYIRILRTCLLVHSYVAHCPSPAVYLFRIYRTEMPFVAAYLRERGVWVHLIPSTSPLTPNNKYLVGDSLKICNPYQLDEFVRYRDSGTCKHYELWSPEEIHLLAPHYATRTIQEHCETIGLYTQGFWLRTRLGTVGRQMGEELARQEEDLIQVMLTYVQQRPDVKLIVFPHPMERRHYTKTGEYPFDSLLEHPQTEVDFSGGNSIYQFDRVGLGVTTTSTVGFDRVYLGFRTLFYTPHSLLLDLQIPSPFNAIFLQTQDRFLALVEQVRLMGHAEFMEHFFGGLPWRKVDLTPKASELQ